MITRRNVLKGALAASAAFAASPLAAAQNTPAKAEAFTLPPLPYPVEALEPFIDAQTMQIHHDKHHAAYVTNLNKAVAEQASLAGKTVEDLLRGLANVPESVRTAVRNHGGGHANHSMFWTTLKKNPNGRPSGELASAIDRKFGSFATFQADFTKAASSLFGSGWVWLSVENKDLRIESTPNQDSPLSSGRTPLLGIDLWEHAYYLKYQNRRPEYIGAFFNVIDWEAVSERHAKIGK